MNFNYWSLTDQSLQICKDEHTHLLIVEKKNQRSTMKKSRSVSSFSHLFLSKLK